MTTATLSKPQAPTLDSLYALTGPDLRRVDALILSRVGGDVPLIGDIARHIVASGGKRIRPALTIACARACGYEGNDHIALAAAIEFIHTATLLHDDVVDESKLRRGLATANEIFGNKASVLVGDFLLSQAFQLMVGGNSMRRLDILASASAVIAKGEVLQLMQEGDMNTSIERYLQVIGAKTAELFAAACELGAAATDDETYAPALREFGLQLGIAFQLVDDALDYSSDRATLGKNTGDDFAEGKITLPVILAWHEGSAGEKEFWTRVLSERRQQKGDFDTAVKLLRKHGALARTAAAAQGYCRKASAALHALPVGAARAALQDTVDFCATRAY